MSTLAVGKLVVLVGTSYTNVRCMIANMIESYYQNLNFLVGNSGADDTKETASD